MITPAVGPFPTTTSRMPREGCHPVRAVATLVVSVDRRLYRQHIDSVLQNQPSLVTSVVCSQSNLCFSELTFLHSGIPERPDMSIAATTWTQTDNDLQKQTPKSTRPGSSSKNILDPLRKILAKHHGSSPSALESTTGRSLPSAAKPPAGYPREPLVRGAAAVTELDSILMDDFCIPPPPVYISPTTVLGNYDEHGHCEPLEPSPSSPSRSIHPQSVHCGQKLQTPKLMKAVNDLKRKRQSHGIPRTVARSMPKSKCARSSLIVGTSQDSVISGAVWSWPPKAATADDSLVSFSTTACF